MREIKFRAWQTVTKTMFHNIEKGTGAYGGNPPFADYLENDHMIVMQFTGLKDKNGKEVYEGDIVRHQDISWGTYEEVVKYEQGLWNYSSGIVSGCRCQKPHIHWEVIGNIYENPELLN